MHLYFAQFSLIQPTVSCFMSDRQTYMYTHRKFERCKILFCVCAQTVTIYMLYNVAVSTRAVHMSPQTAHNALHSFNVFGASNLFHESCKMEGRSCDKSDSEFRVRFFGKGERSYKIMTYAFSMLFVRFMHINNVYGFVGKQKAVLCENSNVVYLCSV